jgi:opacity protein-like surface antigen
MNKLKTGVQMKKFLFTMVTILGLSTMVMAGGDIAPIEEPKAVVTQDVAKDFYVGVGITGGQTYVDGESDWFNDTDYAETGYGVQLNVGYVAYRAADISVSIEGRVQGTVWDYFTSAEDADMLTYSVLLKPEYNFSDYGVYALAGYGTTKVSFGDDSIRENGFVWGVGAEYAINDTFGVYADYVVNPDFDDDEFYDSIKNDVVAIGVTYKF